MKGEKETAILSKEERVLLNLFVDDNNNRIIKKIKVNEDKIEIAKNVFSMTFNDFEYSLKKEMKNSNKSKVFYNVDFSENKQESTTTVSHEDKLYIDAETLYFKLKKIEQEVSEEQAIKYLVGFLEYNKIEIKESEVEVKNVLKRVM